MAMKARMKGGPRNCITSLNVLTKVWEVPTVSAWPTPTASDWKGSGPTMVRADGKMRGDRLDYASEQVWATPTVPNGGRSFAPGSISATGKKLDGRKGQIDLAYQSKIWATPTVKGNHNRAGISPKAGDGLATQAARLFETNSDTHLPDLGRPTTGDVSSPPAPTSRLRLNPSFVEWLMGWPEGWTQLSLAASTPSAQMPCGCSETAFTLWRRLMRSELSRLASLREAAPVQGSLFG